MKKVLILTIITPGILVVAIYLLARMGASHQPVVACKADALLCPDGSSVVRTSPACEFAPCPSVAPPQPATPETTPGVKVTQVGLGQTITDNDIRIHPLKLESDSRCPLDVNCIQAGTVRITVELKREGESKSISLSLGESVRFGDKRVEFSSVDPQKYSKVTITPETYRFVFLVSAGK